MLEWTCYTEYGMPSGHSMMAIILMEFIVRFFAKVNKCVSKCIILFYILIIILQVCVMFSRVILGMHSLNQVLLGCLLGCFSFIPYYLFIERLILKWIIFIF
jgi:membrane-associated phospholipid phosphatase